MKIRPININPLSIRLPIPAWISITHRMSGLGLFVLVPLLLWMFDISLASEESFLQLSQMMSTWWIQILLFFFVASLLFHLVAGARHLLMDMNFGESLLMGRVTSWCVIGVSASLILYAIYWIWG